MKTITLIMSFLFFLIGTTSVIADSKEISYTLDDRERLIKLEEKLNTTNEKINSLESKFDLKFDSFEKRMDSMQILIYFVLGGMMTLIGFVLWDRRSTLKPVENQA